MTFEENILNLPNGKSFGYLNKMIQDASDEIILESDIILHDSEASKYLEGIELKYKDLIINGNGHSIDAKSMTKIFDIYRSRITFKNITFKNGYCRKNGGAIESHSSTLNISGCSFESDKSESGYGGAIYSGFDEVIIETSRFSGNSADMGGAIYTWESKMSVSDSTFSENSASKGGAIDNGSSLKLESCRFQDNSSNDGGAISNYSSLSINQSHFENNTSSKNGGAISNKGDMAIQKSYFRTNTAHYGGALRNDKSMSIVESNFEKNKASIHGGAIFDYECAFILRCCFKQNCARRGSGIYTTNYYSFTNELCLIDECEFKDNSQPTEVYFEDVTHRFILTPRNGNLR